MCSIDQAMQDLEDAECELEEANECGTLEERMDASIAVEQAKFRLDKARIDGY